ncbi:MAG: hypothetical protein HOA17_05690 [Candidatus Melainabacteria bacterium]|nr:hypothetical protein [Candidatus Melainabacteria bacterium]
MTDINTGNDFYKRRVAYHQFEAVNKAKNVHQAQINKIQLDKPEGLKDSVELSQQFIAKHRNNSVTYDFRDFS